MRTNINPDPTKRYASAYASLAPKLLLPRRHPPSALVFPFDQPGLHYYHLARNGIYALAQHWELAGQEVLFPAYFHGVELEALVHAGVHPHFYPVHWGMRVDAEEVTSLVSPKTRAIYVTHFFGFPGPVEHLAGFCRLRNILLIEDCALALLSRLGDRPLGSFGDAAVFCLYKTLPVPNGGAVLVREGSPGLPERDGKPPGAVSCLADLAVAVSRHFRTKGMIRARALDSLRSVGRSVASRIRIARADSTEFDPAALNLRMSRICYGIIQRQSFNLIVDQRRRNYAHLLVRLADVVQPIFPELPKGVCPLSFPIAINSKQPVVDKLFECGIEAVNFWSRHHRLAPPGTFCEVDELRRSVIEIPCHHDLTDDAIEWIAEQVRRISTASAKFA